MNSQSHNVRTSLLLSVATLAFASLPACATDQARTTAAPTQATAKPSPCKSGDTVGFSCEMRDHRVIALCASSGFEKFQGDPKDNPGYAYVRVGSPQGALEYIYPEDPQEYKKYMYYWVSLSAAPNMFITTEKGAFLHFSLDEQSPVDLMQEKLPQSWQKASLSGTDLCAKNIRRDELDPFMAQMMRKAAWEQANGKKTAQ